MRVNFVSVSDSTVASYRLRTLVASRALCEAGHHATISREPIPGCDCYVFAKHFNPEDRHHIANVKARGAVTVFDVCDNHLSNRLAGHYRYMMDVSHHVVAATTELRNAIFYRATGLPSDKVSVIDDPFEGDERDAVTPRGQNWLWFGHLSNLGALIEALPQIRGHVNAVTGMLDEEVVPDRITLHVWSPGVLVDVASRCDACIIPQRVNSVTWCKSANRMVTALRMGLFPICSPLPAYTELKDFGWVGDIEAGIEWLATHQAAAEAAVQAGQDYIRSHLSPETIGEKWTNLIEGLVRRS